MFEIGQPVPHGGEHGAPEIRVLGHPALVFAGRGHLRLQFGLCYALDRICAPFGEPGEGLQADFTGAHPAKHDLVPAGAGQRDADRAFLQNDEARTGIVWREQDSAGRAGQPARALRDRVRSGPAVTMKKGGLLRKPP